MTSTDSDVTCVLPHIPEPYHAKSPKANNVEFYFIVFNANPRWHDVCFATGGGISMNAGSEPRGRRTEALTVSRLG